MEDWISLLTLDSQTSSQIISEDFLRRIAQDLKEANPLSKDNFETLTNALSDKFTSFVFNDVPVVFYEVLRCLGDHLFRRNDVNPPDIRNFFLNFVYVLLKAAPDSLVPTLECILDIIHTKIIDISFSVYAKHVILSSLNELSVISSAKKDMLFLKPKIFRIYTLLASNLRAIGEYDTQTQLLEFLLHVIPSARRRFFVERYIHPDFVDPFCAIIVQRNFLSAARKFLNLFNAMDPLTQSVFSLPCTEIQLCGYELKCQPTFASPSDGDYLWIDFNLIPQSITTYCILAAQAVPHSYASEDPNEQIWKTISISAEVIKEVNVSSIHVDDGRGTQVERINLSITTTESPSAYARFWESDSSPCHFHEENFTTIEFCLVPSDVVRSVPTKAPEIPVTKDNDGAIQSQQQQLIGLLTGLRAYAEQRVASSSAFSSQSSFEGSQGLSQQRRTPLKSKNIFASCKSPLPVDVGRGLNSPAKVPLPSPPPPKPKSFFTDPDISFEESAEGLGLHIPSPRMPTPRVKSKMKLIAQTPLNVRTREEEEEIGNGRRRSSGAQLNRSVNSPFSVVSGLETPTPVRSSDTLDGPHLGTVNLISSDDDIASGSHNKLSAEERLAEEIEEDETPPPKTKLPPSKLSSAKCKERDSTSYKPLPAVSQKQTGASQSDKETPASQTSLSKAMHRGRSKTVPAVKTTPIIIERGCTSHTLKKQTSRSASSVEKAKMRTSKKLPAISTNPTPLGEVFPYKGDVYDLAEISEIEETVPKFPNPETFEKFVTENNLEMLSKNKRCRLRVETSDEGDGLIEEISSELDKEAIRLLAGGIGRGRKASRIDGKSKVTKDTGNDGAITEVPSSLQSDTQNVMLKPPTTMEVERVCRSDERPARQTRSGKRFSQSPVNVEAEDCSRKTKGRTQALKGKGRGGSTNRKDNSVETAETNKDELKEGEEASKYEILAGSPDVLRLNQLSQGKIPIPMHADINPSQKGSLSRNRNNVSPLFMSPLTRLEAAVNTLELSEEQKKTNLTPIQANLHSSRLLYDINASYLTDQSPGVLSQEQQIEAPPPGGLIVPAFGNKYYNIKSKSAFLSKTADDDTKADESALQERPPKREKKTATTADARSNKKGNGRRFFTTTFAERNKQEVERHFFKVVGELSDPSTPKTGGSQLKSGRKGSRTSAAKQTVKRQRKPNRQTKKSKAKINLSYLEDARNDDDDSSGMNFDPYSLENDSGGHDQSSHELRSRPAIRKAAKLAKIKIMETSFDTFSIQNCETPRPSSLTFVNSPRGDLTATFSSIERPRRNLNASQASLFDPTPNNTAIFDFTLSEDDELVSGLPRFEEEPINTKPKVKEIKLSHGEDAVIIDLDEGVQPKLSFDLIGEIFRIIDTFDSTVKLTESDFNNRIGRLKEQVDEMRRLLKWSQMGQSDGRKA